MVLAVGRVERVAWLLVAAWGLGTTGEAVSQHGAPAGDETATTGPLFVDGTAASGLHAVHDNGADGRLELLAIMGPGAALFDYDLDGDLDLYLPAGGSLPGDSAGDERSPAGRLLRNDPDVEEDGRVMPRWVDVTATAGLTVPGYAMGAAVGDVDGDGAPDLFVPVLGRDQLWRNRGDGTFANISAELGGGASWSVAGSFFDADGDGDLDLYVVRYVVPTAGVRCFAESTRPDYCGPAAYPALPDRLLRNRGDGTFDDVSVPSGVGRVAAPGLGAVAGDFDGDGRMDLYVANDGEANFLWHNRGGGTFSDEGPLSGTALSREGLPQAGMGVDSADADGDLEEDLFVTNLTGETNTLYQAAAPGVFSDRTAAFGLAAPSLPWTGFGTGFVDADLDGRLDLVVVNGAVRLAHTDAGEALSALPAHHLALAQPAQLYRNLGNGFVSLAAEQAGPALTAPAVSRGLAFGDVDGDGDEDLVVAVNGGAAQLLLATPPPQATWVAVAACPGMADPHWLAHRVVVRPAATVAGDAPAAVVRRPRRDGSYASARQPRALVGLGGAASADIEVIGPAATLRWRGAPAGRTLLWCPAGEER
jgi:enediyne biosynthesis protein E4